MKKNNLTLTFILAFLFIFGGCKPRTQGNDGELITTIKITLKDSAGSHVYQWRDLDGPGGADPVVDSIILTSNIYIGKIELLDESKTPAFDVTAEIEKEKDVHRFFYTPSIKLDGRAWFVIMDYDNHNLPVGLEYYIQTAGWGKVVGTIKVVLSHYDGIEKNTKPSPESDVDIDWPARLD